MIFPSVAAWIYFFAFADSPRMPVIYAVCKVVQFAFPVAWIVLARLDRPVVPSSPGLYLVPGVFLGLGMVSLMGVAYLTVIRGSDLARVSSLRIAARIEAIGAAGPARFLALTLFLAVAHSFLEEYYWRWFVFGRLLKLGGIRIAGVVSSFAFASHHGLILYAFIGSGSYWWMILLLTLGVAAGGGIWAWLYARSGRLYAPWLSHALVDLGIMAFSYDLVGPLG